MANLDTPGRSTGSPTPRTVQPRRVSRELGFVTWAVLLLLSILFTVATAGIGVFAIGIVLCVGVVMAVLGAGRKP